MIAMGTIFKLDESNTNHVMREFVPERVVSCGATVMCYSKHIVGLCVRARISNTTSIGHVRYQCNHICIVLFEEVGFSRCNESRNLTQHALRMRKLTSAILGS